MVMRAHGNPIINARALNISEERQGAARLKLSAFPYPGLCAARRVRAIRQCLTRAAAPLG